MGCSPQFIPAEADFVQLCNSCRDAPPLDPSMLNRYIYDTSSLPDRLYQPESETAAERLARLKTSVDLATATLNGTSDDAKQ